MADISKLKEGSFVLAFQGFQSVMDWLHCFLLVARQIYHDRGTSQRKAAHFIASRKQKRKIQSSNIFVIESL